MATHAEIMEAAKHDPILAHMVKRNMPLTRDQWIRLAYLLNDLPEEWTSEHEEAVPRVFRSDHSEED
jgi:hypothetical protein